MCTSQDNTGIATVTRESLDGSSRDTHTLLPSTQGFSSNSDYPGIIPGCTPSPTPSVRAGESLLLGNPWIL